MLSRTFGLHIALVLLVLLPLNIVVFLPAISLVPPLDEQLQQLSDRVAKNRGGTRGAAALDGVLPRLMRLVGVDGVYMLNAPCVKFGLSVSW